MEGESAPTTQSYCPVPCGREGQHYFKLSKNVSNGVSIFPPAVPPSALEHRGAGGLMRYSGSPVKSSAGLAELTDPGAGSAVPRALAQTSRLFPGFQIK